MPKNTDICKECGNEYNMHSTDGARCPKNGGWPIGVDKLEFFAARFEPEISEIDQLRAEIAILTAGSEAMQEDAAQNTITIKMLMAQLAEVNEENRGLRQMLHMEPR